MEEGLLGDVSGELWKVIAARTSGLEWRTAIQMDSLRRCIVFGEMLVARVTRRRYNYAPMKTQACEVSRLGTMMLASSPILCDQAEESMKK